MSKLQEVSKLLAEEMQAANSTETSQGKGANNERKSQRLPKEPKDTGPGADTETDNESGGIDGSGESELEAEDKGLEDEEQGEEETGQEEEASAEQLELDQQREEVNNQLLEVANERRDIDEFMQWLGDAVPEPIREKYREFFNARVEREKLALSRVLPRWQLPEVREVEHARIFTLAARYGISQGEVEAYFTNHRIVKLLRDVANNDYYRQKSKVKATRSAPRELTGATNALVKKAKEPGSRNEDRVKAISSILKG